MTINVSGRIGDPDAASAPPRRVPASLAECTDRADVLAWLCEKHGATSERSTPAEGIVRLTLITSDGDQVSGQGASTAMALNQLLAKLGETST